MCLLRKTIPTCLGYGPRSQFNGTDAEYDSLANASQYFAFSAMTIATFAGSIVVLISHCFKKPSPRKGKLPQKVDKLFHTDA